MFEDRIKKGMTYLDRELPDWEWRVNLETLELRSCTSCVIGQLFCSFKEWLFVDGAQCEFIGDHGESHTYAVGLGFSLSNVDLYAGSNIYTYIISYTKAWKQLTDEWKTAIRQRRAEKGVDSCQNSRGVSCELAH